VTSDLSYDSGLGCGDAELYRGWPLAGTSVFPLGDYAEANDIRCCACMVGNACGYAAMISPAFVLLLLLLLLLAVLLLLVLFYCGLVLRPVDGAHLMPLALRPLTILLSLSAADCCAGCCPPPRVLVPPFLCGMCRGCISFLEALSLARRFFLLRCDDVRVSRVTVRFMATGILHAIGTSCHPSAYGPCVDCYQGLSSLLVS
jgi:hypothetical protein